MVIVDIHDSSYSIPRNLWNHWDKNNLAKLKKRNMDKVYVVDGSEGTGKSLWTIQQAGFLDKTMFSTPEEMCRHIVFTPEDFYKAVTTLKNTVIIFDEAFRGLSSRSALSKENRKLVQLLQEMRQQNNIIFIVLPSIFLLDMYPAMLRSTGLFNIYIDKRSGKRVWNGYNKDDKNRIYQNGVKKGWKYIIKSRFRGNFYGKFPGGDKFEKAYLDLKGKALKESFSEDVKVIESKYKIQRDLLLLYAFDRLKKSDNLTQQAFIESINQVNSEYLNFSRSSLPKLQENLRKMRIPCEL